MNVYLAVALTIFFLSGGCLGGGSEKDTAPPPPVPVPRLTISDINVDFGSNSANLTWSTNNQSDSMVRYGAVSGKYTDSEGNRDYTLSHSITLRGLIPGNTYYYKVGSVGPNGIATQSAEYNFTTIQMPFPQISNVSVNPSSTVALIEWITDIPSDSRVMYGTGPINYPMYNESKDYVTSHNITLEGLAPGTTYYYKVGSTSPNAVFNESAGLKFKAEPARILEDITFGNLEIEIRNFGLYSVESGDTILYYSRALIAIENTGEDKIPVTISSTAIVDSVGHQSDLVRIGAPDEFRPTEIFPGGKITRALYYERILGSSGTLHISINSRPYQFHVR